MLYAVFFKDTYPIGEVPLDREYTLHEGVDETDNVPLEIRVAHNHIFLPYDDTNADYGVIHATLAPQTETSILYTPHYEPLDEDLTASQEKIVRKFRNLFFATKDCDLITLQKDEPFLLSLDTPTLMHLGHFAFHLHDRPFVAYARARIKRGF